MNPRESALSRPVALRLAATEYDRCAETFRFLSPAQWATPTDCPAWDVRQMAAHMLGMAEMAASIRENLRQQRKAAKAVAAGGGLYIDALTQLQVEERADWTPERITERYTARAPKATAGRRRTPGFVRRRTMPQAQEINGVTEPWTLGYLIDVILTRDPWMHRMDIAAATGTPPQLTAGHDDVIVADVVAEWAGQPHPRRPDEHRGPVLDLHQQRLSGASSSAAASAVRPAARPQDSRAAGDTRDSGGPPGPAGRLGRAGWSPGSIAGRCRGTTERRDRPHSLPRRLTGADRPVLGRVREATHGGQLGPGCPRPPVPRQARQAG